MRSPGGPTTWPATPRWPNSKRLRERYEAALSVLVRAGEKFPGDVTVSFVAGSVYERQKRFADAERKFREVLAKDPLHAPALNYLGYMLADRGERLDEAVGYIKRALAADPYNGAYLDSLGWAYFRQNKLDLADQNLSKAAAQRARDSAVQDHYGDLLFKLGRYQEAVSVWQRALGGDGEQIDRGAIDRKMRSATREAAEALMRRPLGFILLLVAGAGACAPRLLQLPSGDGEAFPGYQLAFDEASRGCRDVRSLSAELAISGRAGGERLRGRVLAGIARPGRLRLEAVAPFGPPVFILAASGTSATLLLPRDNRVLTGEPASAVLGALVGLELGPDDLLAILTGCVVVSPEPSAGRRYPGGWARVDLADGAVAYLGQDGERWRIRAGARAGLAIEYEPAAAGGLSTRAAPGLGERRDAGLRRPNQPVAGGLERAARPRGLRREGASGRDVDHAGRRAQRRAHRGEAMILRAHAKVNVSLAVVGVRPDGYHELRTVFQSLALHDTLRFAHADEGLAMACSAPGVPLDERNLVWKAAELVWAAAGRRGEPGGRVRITKRIPVAGWAGRRERRRRGRAGRVEPAVGHEAVGRAPA